MCFFFVKSNLGKETCTLFNIIKVFWKFYSICPFSRKIVHIQLEIPLLLAQKPSNLFVPIRTDNSSQKACPTVKGQVTLSNQPNIRQLGSGIWPKVEHFCAKPHYATKRLVGDSVFNVRPSAECSVRFGLKLTLRMCKFHNEGRWPCLRK